MTAAAAKAYYDPIGGETVNYVSTSDAKAAIDIIYADFAAADALKVNVTSGSLTSPTMTGTPIAPTAATGTDTNHQVATVNYVAAKIPEMLAGNVTLGAGAVLASDIVTPVNTRQIATTGWVTTQVNGIITGAGYAPITNANLLGTPTAPTPAVGDNDTSIATTAFVNAEIANDAPTKTGTGASGTWPISITGSSTSTTGNAATATKLATSRTIALSGFVTGSATFDGSANLTIDTTLTTDSALTVWRRWYGTQAQYDAVAIKDTNTLYVVY